MLLGLNLILHPFCNIIVIGCSLVPMTCLTIGSWPNNGARIECYLMEQYLNPIRKCLFFVWLFLLLFFPHWPHATKALVVIFCHYFSASG